MAFAIAGYALLLEPLLPFLSPTHCGRRPYWPLLAATLAQRAHSGLLLGPQKHQRSALSLAVRPLAQPRVHASSLKVGSDIRNISGATLSSLHVTEGVKRILAAYGHLQ
jgi:hypothetical protein